MSTTFSHFVLSTDKLTGTWNYPQSYLYKLNRPRCNKVLARSQTNLQDFNEE